jgi:hypothetical protein
MISFLKCYHDHEEGGGGRLSTRDHFVTRDPLGCWHEDGRCVRPHNYRREDDARKDDRTTSRLEYGPANLVVQCHPRQNVNPAIPCPVNFSTKLDLRL